MDVENMVVEARAKTHALYNLLAVETNERRVLEVEDKDAAAFLIQDVLDTCQSLYEQVCEFESPNVG